MANNSSQVANSAYISDVYLGLAASNNVAALCKRAHNVILRAGFSDFCYVLLSHVGTILGQVGTHSEKIDQHYLDQFRKYDLVIQHCLVSDEAIFQSDVLRLVDSSPIESRLFDKTRQFSRFLELFGYKDYLVIPFSSGSNDGKAVFYVGSKSEGPAEFRQRVLRFKASLIELARTFDEVINQKFPGTICGYKSEGRVTINAKPLLLLDVLANHNVTLNEASDILHISISTANQHIATAKKALGAQTIAAAIVAAIRLKFIEIKGDD